MCYVNLKPYVKPQEELEKYYNMSELLTNMFDSDKITLLESFADDPYIGDCHALFQCKDHSAVFTARVHYGSCDHCDEWVDTHDPKSVDRIIEGVQFFDSLQDVTVNVYCHPEWKKRVAELQSAQLEDIDFQN